METEQYEANINCVISDMNLSVKPGTDEAKTRLDHLCESTQHSNVLTIKTGNEQKGNLCRGLKSDPLH